MSARKHRMPPVDHAYCCLHGPCRGMREATANGRVICRPDGYEIVSGSMATSGYAIAYCPWCGEKLADVRAE